MRRCIGVAEVESSNSDPCLQVSAFGQVGELLNHSSIVLVRRNKTECVWVNECKGEKKMGVSGGVELLRGHAVTLAIAEIPTLKITYLTSLGASATLGT